KRLYATGDLVKLLPGEIIEYLGRIDHQVKIRGFRVELGEIENILSEQSGVVDAIAVMKEDNDNKYIVAYIVPERFDMIGEFTSQLLLSLKRSLPNYMIPRYIEVLDKFPLTPNGKVDRNKLSAKKIHHDFITQNHCEPRDLNEDNVLAIFKHVLN